MANKRPWELAVQTGVLGIPQIPLQHAGVDDPPSPPMELPGGGHPTSCSGWGGRSQSRGHQ
jgi:hypothetical protein